MRKSPPRRALPNLVVRFPLTASASLSQTGAYPIDSPGGWQFIGRTPVRMYDLVALFLALPKAGQYIKFYAIDQAEFDRIAALEASSGYTVHTYPRKEAEQA